MTDTNTLTPPVTSTEQIIEQKILHILKLYPRISPSMMQISLGSGMPVSIWQPILEQLIASGQVFRWEKSVVSPGGRCSSATFLSLTAPNVHNHTST